jgi:hypothetical protein
MLVAFLHSPLVALRWPGSEFLSILKGAALLSDLNGEGSTAFGTALRSSAERLRCAVITCPVSARDRVDRWLPDTS